MKALLVECAADARRLLAEALLVLRTPEAPSVLPVETTTASEA